MTVRQCPRPSCGFQFPDATDTGMFVTCHACGLQFCFNPDIKHLGLKDEDEKLQIIHQREDSSSFGRRYVPKDVIDFQHKDEITYEVTSLSAAYSPMPEIEPKRSEAQKLTSDNLTALEILSSKEIISSQVKLVSRDSPQLPSIDWNNGTSGMTAWLNSSAAPAHEGEHLGLKSDAFQAETEQLQQEWKDIECLTRVHFVSTVSESQPLRDIVNEYQAMPLDAQVYVRKIVDRFPTLPSYLAKRFANANARRLSRLQQRKESDVNEVNPPTSLGSKSPNTNGHSAKPRLTTDCNRVGASVESPNYQKVLFNSNPNLRNGENQIVRTINKTKEFVESRPNPSSEALKTSTNNLTTAGKLPRQTQLKCYQCKFYSNSYRTKQELQQHIALAHGKKKRKVFTCVDESPDQKMLANCADCRDSKIYNAYHEAIAHLRRTHLSLWTTELKSKSGKIRSHQMNIPMHIHIKKIELDTVGNDVGAATSMLGPLT